VKPAVSSKPFSDSDDNLSLGLKVSVGLHLALFAFFTVRAVFFTPEAIHYESAIRVDMVGLPDKMMPEKLAPPAASESKAEAKPEPKPEKAEPVKKPSKAEPKPVVKVPPKPAVKPSKSKDPEAINLTKDKQKQKAALEKLKALSALEEIKNEAAQESKKIAGVGKPAAPGTKIKGNVLSPGTELTGLSKLQHDNYLATLDQQIKRNWFLPQWLAKKPLRAQVRLRLNDKGEILAREIALSSGNSSYDDLALSTIDRSAPFPPPPEKFVSILEVNGLLIGFPE
jgi:colicin import membrane protein